MAFPPQNSGPGSFMPRERSTISGSCAQNASGAVVATLIESMLEPPGPPPNHDALRAARLAHRLGRNARVGAGWTLNCHERGLRSLMIEPRAAMPPSMVTIDPVIYPARGEARKTIRSA